MVLFRLHFKWSGGRLDYRGAPHGDLVGYRSSIDHMESHQVYYCHQYVHNNIY